MGNYSRYERETVIVMNDEEDAATVCTFQRVMQRNLERLAASRPDQVRVIKTYADDDGITVRIPKRWIKVKIPRAMTEEQRKRAAARLSDYFTLSVP